MPGWPSVRLYSPSTASAPEDTPVRIRAARLFPYRLPLRSIWANAAGCFDARAGTLVKVETDDGLAGFGDCAPLAATGTESPREALKSVLEWCQAASGREVRDALDGLGMASAPAARCAVESALLDLVGQSQGLPVFGVLGGEASLPTVRVNAAIGALEDSARSRAEAAVRAGFAVLKFKVGIAPLCRELPLLRELASALPAAVTLRLDANGAWDESAAAAWLDACAGLPVECIEEPLAGADRAGLRRLQARCPFPLGVDESWSEGEEASFLAAPPVRRLILKPPRLGGLEAAVKLGQRAASAGVECVVTSSVDSACGIFAAAQVAAALDNGLAHGLATSSWLAQDVGVPPSITGGRMTLPDFPGLGFVPECGIDFIDAEALRASAAAKILQ